MNYERPVKAYKKLKEAENTFTPVIISASTGWGKTALTDHYYRHRSALNLTGASGKLDAMPDPEDIRPTTIVIDDVGWIVDEASMQYIENLVYDKSHHVVILTRSDLMPWLVPASLTIDFAYIRESDLALDLSSVMNNFHSEGSLVSDEDITQVCEFCRGFPLAIKLFKRHLEHGDSMSGALVAEVLDELYNYFDRTTFCKWPDDVRRFLLATCRYPEFSTKMAEKLVSNINVHATIDYCRRVGSFLRRKGGKMWAVRQELRYFLKWKLFASWTKEELNDNLRIAGDYYVSINDLSEALNCYEKADLQNNVRDILVRNATLHPGIGQYYELRKYYENLPEEITKEDPLLMLGISFMYSMTLRPDESERWYDELVAFAKAKDIPSDKRKAAKTYTTYLDFNLPHRKFKSLENIIHDASVLTRSQGFVLPKSAITGNQPSVMNGGLDVCEWSKRDKFIANMLKLPFSKVMGSGAAGLINTGLAESGYEKGIMPSEEIISLLSSAYTDAYHNGTMEMCFAAEGVLIKYYLTSGDMQKAAELLATFKQNMYARGALHLEENVKAMEARLAIFRGDSDAVRSWLRESPDEKVDFYTMDRYIYMTKLRCLMATNQLEAALALSTYMDKYIIEYNRNFLSIENRVLRSIILNRLGNESWRDVLADALKTADEFHFVWVVALHGRAVVPLLEELFDTKAVPASELNRTILRSAKKMALHYPNYLEINVEKFIQFTAREEEILAHLCSGLSTKEICNICNLTYSGLKKHNRNIYSKLNVKNRADAERVASRLGLVHK